MARRRRTDARRVSAVLSGERGCRPFPRTPFSASGRPPPLRSGWFPLTKSNTSRKIRRPASLRSDGVRLQPGIPFGFPSEKRSPSPESAPMLESRCFLRCAHARPFHPTQNEMFTISPRRFRIWRYYCARRHPPSGPKLPIPIPKCYKMLRNANICSRLTFVRLM